LIPTEKATDQAAIDKYAKMF